MLTSSLSSTQLRPQKPELAQSASQISTRQPASPSHAGAGFSRQPPQGAKPSPAATRASQVNIAKAQEPQPSTARTQDSQANPARRPTAFPIRSSSPPLGPRRRPSTTLTSNPPVSSGTAGRSPSPSGIVGRSPSPIVSRLGYRSPSPPPRGQLPFA